MRRIFNSNVDSVHSNAKQWVIVRERAGSHGCTGYFSTGRGKTDRQADHRNNRHG